VRGVPPPLYAITPPPLSVTGEVVPPPRLAGYSMRNVGLGTGSKGGVVPCFVRNRGGGGLFVKKENRGEGGGNNFGGHPPCPDHLGEGLGGSWAGSFLRIAGPGLEVFE